jgi:hypothetical protein
MEIRQHVIENMLFKNLFRANMARPSPDMELGPLKVLQPVA